MGEAPKIKEVKRPELQERRPPGPPEYEVISILRPAEAPSTAERPVELTPVLTIPEAHSSSFKQRDSMKTLLVIVLLVLVAGNMVTGYFAFQSKSKLDDLAKQSSKWIGFVNFFQDTRIELRQLLFTAGAYRQEQQIRLIFARPEDLGLSKSDRISVTYEILNITLAESVTILVAKRELDIFSQTRFQVPNSTASYAYPAGDYSIRINGEFQGLKLSTTKAWIVRPDQNPPKVIILQASLRGVVARVFDEETSVKQVTLFFATIDALAGRKPWNRSEMKTIDRDTYSASFPEGTSAPIVFFIEASDLAGNIQRTEPQVIALQGPQNPALDSTSRELGGITFPILHSGFESFLYENKSAFWMGMTSGSHCS